MLGYTPKKYKFRFKKIKTKVPEENIGELLLWNEEGILTHSPETTKTIN